MGQRHRGDAKQRRTAERNLLCVRHQAYIDLGLALRFPLGGVLPVLGCRVLRCALNECSYF